MDTWAATIKDWTTGATLAESDLDQEIRDRWTVFLAAMDGDTSGSTVKHRHKTGTLANRPTPGEAGRLYLPTDIGITLYDDGTEWLIGESLFQKSVGFMDDFVVAFSLNWETANTGTGSIAQIDWHGGAIKLDTGVTASSNARLMNNTVGGRMLVPSKIFLMLIALTSDQPAAVNQYKSVGMMRSTPTGAADPVSGIYLRKVNDGNWFGVCRNSSTETTQDLGGTLDSESLVIVERTSSGVNFYVDTFNAAGKKGSEITTNIPSDALLAAARVNNTAAAASRTLTLNTFGLRAAR